MSAWIVERGHIDVLVAAGVGYQVIPVTDAVGTGARLWRENHESVNFRYREDESTPAYGPAPHPTERLHPVAVLKALDCYDYQSCEHDGWASSAAAEFTTLLRLAVFTAEPALAKMIRDAHYADGQKQTNAYTAHPVYDQAPWGFTTLAQSYVSVYAPSTTGGAA